MSLCDGNLHKFGSIHASLIILCLNSNRIQGENFAPVKCNKAPGDLGCYSLYFGGSVVVDLLFIALPINGGVLCLPLFCYELLCVQSSFAIILKRRRKCVALFLSSYRCLVTVNVMWLFLTVM